jgi:8-hydroxy-5-deazaflavin:NADPH oxidoreductase
MRRLITTVAAVGLTAGLTVMPVTAETIAMIGTGEVGSALGKRFAEQGHTVVYGSRSPERADVVALVAESGARAAAATPAAAAAGADIVVLAVPWETVEDVTRALGDLSGQIVVDPTNPRQTTADGYRDYAFDGSNAERIQALAADAAVVKAFNTLGADTMTDPALAGGPVSIPIAGDDPRAKAKVAELVAAIGLEAVDVGPLRYARILEGLHFLRYNAGLIERRFNYHLRAEMD